MSASHIIKSCAARLLLISFFLMVYHTCCLANDITTIQVGDVVVANGGIVDVPIELISNTGICGATITVSYDERLILNSIDRGTALASLTMTKPGRLSANPVNITWDGLEQDATTGIMVSLSFVVPNSNGEYSLTLSYDEGGIVDGNLNAVNVNIIQGRIKVLPEGEQDPEYDCSFDIDTESMTATAHLFNRSEKDKVFTVIVASYSETGVLSDINIKEVAVPAEAAAHEIYILQSDSYNKSISEVRGYIWNSIKEIKPLAKSCEANITVKK